MTRPPSSLIAVHSGVLVDPLNLRPPDIRIEDIAHALAHLCRFTGHVRRFYSVAEHSVRVSHLVPPEHALWGLLHDATEAYLGDVARPLKEQPLMEGYRKLEAHVAYLIEQRFNLGPEPGTIKVADREACAQEGMVLVPGWRVRPDRTGPVVWGLAPPAAKKAFLDRFEALTALRAAA